MRYTRKCNVDTHAPNRISPSLPSLSPSVSVSSPFPFISFGFIYFLFPLATFLSQPTTPFYVLPFSFSLLPTFSFWFFVSLCSSSNFIPPLDFHSISGDVSLCFSCFPFLGLAWIGVICFPFNCWWFVSEDRLIQWNGVASICDSLPLIHLHFYWGLISLFCYLFFLVKLLMIGRWLLFLKRNFSCLSYNLNSKWILICNLTFGFLLLVCFHSCMVGYCSLHYKSYQHLWSVWDLEVMISWEVRFTFLAGLLAEFSDELG